MPKLFVEDGDRRALVDLPAGAGLTIGRSTAADLVVQAPRASRRHAEITADGDGHRVRDLGSTNGTLRNGAPFEGAARLEDGDVLDCAGARIVYRSRP